MDANLWSLIKQKLDELPFLENVSDYDEAAMQYDGMIANVEWKRALKVNGEKVEFECLLQLLGQDNGFMWAFGLTSEGADFEVITYLEMDEVLEGNSQKLFSDLLAAGTSQHNMMYGSDRSPEEIAGNQRLIPILQKYFGSELDEVIQAIASAGLGRESIHDITGYDESIIKKINKRLES
jgi:hypothetical protein